MSQYQKFKIPGFLVVCLKCGRKTVKIESRADGVDFQCTHPGCGNKMLLRPGDIMRMEFQPGTQKQHDKQEEKFTWIDDTMEEIQKKWDDEHEH